MVRNSWKKYFTHVFPHSFNTIRNFLGCCMAEGKNNGADDSDDEKNDKAIPFAWNVADVESALNHIRTHHHHHLFLIMTSVNLRFCDFTCFFADCKFMDSLQCVWIRQLSFLFNFDFFINMGLPLHHVRKSYSSIWIFV